MRDSRVTLWANPSELSATTTSVTGPTVDLLEDIDGDYVFGSGDYGYGLGAEVMAYSAVLGTDADGFTLTWKWQFAPNNAGVAGTWVDGPVIGVMAYDDVNGWTKDGLITGAALGLSRAKLKARGRAEGNRFARLVCTGGDLEGTVTVQTKAWVSDGSDFINSGLIY